MHLTPTVAMFLIVLLFSSISAATDQLSRNVIRIPLKRRSFITHLVPSSRGTATRANSVAGYVNKDFLRAHLASVAAKYRITLAAYESNIGSPHPLAQAISATSAPVLATDQNASGVTATLPAGKLEKRRRKRDTTYDTPDSTLDDFTSSNHALRGRYTKRGDISLSEDNGNMWAGTVSVGSPPQNFTVDFDTGSADMFLPDQACDSTCNGHTRYNTTASSTSIDLGKTFQLVYHDGSNVNGTQYMDNVYMGGYEAMNQTLGAATTYSSELKSPRFLPDGLLGLAFSPISVFGTPSVFQTMVSDGVVSQGVFGFALSSEPDKSELTIGGTNANMYQGSTMDRPGLNDTPDVAVVNKTSYAQAIIDTGTTLIVTSDSNAQAYYVNVTGAKPSTEIGGGAWSVPCDIVGSLAPTLVFGSRNFTVSASTFNLGPVSEGSTDCIAGLAGGGNDFWIIGDVFLQNVYTIFDVTNTRVGFADLA